MNKTLVIMAAGMASRYGGGKQVDGFGPNGEFLMEYSARDAKNAGFDKIVFIVSQPMVDNGFEADIKSKIPNVEIKIAVQSYASLPKWFEIPEGRVKPYGTVHAVLAAKELVNTRFAVINADDYYGPQAYKDMARVLDEMPEEGYAALLGYPIANTLSENGKVTRGVCETDTEGNLLKLTETDIVKNSDGVITTTEGEPLSSELRVSMNFLGFMPWIFDSFQRELEASLREPAADPMKKEVLVPVILDKLIRAGELKVKVAPTESEWFGVTYQEDKPYVMGRLAEIGGTR